MRQLAEQQLPKKAEKTLAIITASHDAQILSDNLLSSPCIATGDIEVVIQTDRLNVPTAYNEAAQLLEADILCFLHHDVVLPESWADDVLQQVARVEEIDPKWGVLGCIGVTTRDEGKYWVGNVYDRCRQLGETENLPAVVDSLDELAIICRKEDALFDEFMPNHHLFGTEFCLRMRRDKRKCYAINAYCHHNSSTNRLDADFAISAGYLYGKYPEMLPIASTCATIQRRDGVCMLTL